MGRLVIHGNSEQVDEMLSLLEDKVDYRIGAMNSTTFMVVAHPGAQGNNDIIKDAIAEAESVNANPSDALILK